MMPVEGYMVAVDHSQAAVVIDGRPAVLVDGELDPYWAAPGEVFRSDVEGRVWRATASGWEEVSADEADEVWDKAVKGE